MSVLYRSAAPQATVRFDAPILELDVDANSLAVSSSTKERREIGSNDRSVRRTATSIDVQVLD
jgi:hypothetical protein